MGTPSLLKTLATGGRGGREMYKGGLVSVERALLSVAEKSVRIEYDDLVSNQIIEDS